MKVLIIKTSSMGDVIHTLPALTDAGNAIAGIRFDWVVEEGFALIPKLHPLVDRVIPIALRRWRKRLISSMLKGEWWQFYRCLRQTHYDAIIDAQGLMKSALVTRLARGKRCGLNRHSAWEPLASFIYKQRASVDPNLHAVERVRRLFAKSLGYSLPHTLPVCDIDQSRLDPYPLAGDFVVLAHGTTWRSKEWPEAYWITLAQLTAQTGLAVYVPWGCAAEKARAERIAASAEQVQALPKLNLSQLSHVLTQARAVVAVDTGLGHMAAALAVPTISLYGPTDPREIGTTGAGQLHLAAQFECAPCRAQLCSYRGKATVEPACFATITAEMVFEKLQSLLKGQRNE